MQPVWDLSIPLPAVMIITVSLYMILVGISFWVRYCLQDKCSTDCCACCPDVPVCELCFRLAETCDCSLPAVGALLPTSCPAPSCPRWDCACTCQPPECESCNCLCFEIRIK
ncbi:unnamed protein product [Ophioblennius macclurei]